MANRYRKQYEDENQEENENGGDPKEQNVPEGNEDEGNFRQRYGDLRRHSQKTETSLKGEIEELKTRLNEALKSKTKEYPKTEAEVKEWIERYPDLGGIVKTIILQTMEENGDTSGADRIRELEERIERNDIDRQKERAIQEIVKVHPDFHDLIDDTTDKGKKFHDWVEKQSGWVQHALYVNETDSQSAIDAVDLYKSRNKSNNREETRGAASSVRSKPVDAPRGEREMKFSESQVEAMSQKDFERYYDKIQEAIRDGDFEYDLTGDK